jgi:hypothetical protein
MTYTYDELRARISLMEFAQAHGYVLNRRKGLCWPVLQHATGDRVIIVNPNHPGNDGYFNPNDDRDRGTLIHFVTHRLGWLFPQDPTLSTSGNVNRILHDWLQLPYHERRYLAKTALPSRHGSKVEMSVCNPALLTPLTDIGWLRERGILRETLEVPLFRNRIMQYRNGTHVNIAFPYRIHPDGEIVGAELRNHTFKGHMPGSRKSVSIWSSAMLPDTRRIMVCESALDALSHYQLFEDASMGYASFGGQLTLGQIKAIRTLTETAPGSPLQLVIGVDQDTKGAQYAEMLTEAFPKAERIYAEGKDFNEMLQRARKNQSSRLVS